MPVQSFPIGPLATNCHIIHKEQNALVVDPGGSLNDGLSDVLNYLKTHNLTVSAILLTHFHFDHLYGVQALIEKTNTPVFGGNVPDTELEAYLSSGARWGLPKVTPFAWTILEEGICTLGTIPVKTLATPGHSTESLSFYFEEEATVCTGDVLFHHSIGRTDLPGGDMKILLASIREKLFTLPDSTKVCTGHGRNTTIGDEKLHNPYLH